MATKKSGKQIGPVKGRSQIRNPRTGRWVKRNTSSGQSVPRANQLDQRHPLTGVTPHRGRRRS